MEQQGELELCPFCGSKDIFMSHEFNHLGEMVFSGHCLFCGSRGKKHRLSQEKAAVSWNKRTPDATLKAKADRSDELVKVLEKINLSLDHCLSQEDAIGLQEIIDEAIANATSK